MYRVYTPSVTCLIDGEIKRDGRKALCSHSVLPMWKCQTLLLARTLSASVRSSVHVDAKSARWGACHICCRAIQTPPIQAPAMGPEQNAALPMPKVSSCWQQ